MRRAGAGTRSAPPPAEGLTNKMKLDLERFNFLQFIVIGTIVVSVAGALTAASTEEEVFLTFYAFSAGSILVCAAVYIYPIVRTLIYPDLSARMDPGTVLLRGIDGERPRARSRELEDILRRTKI